MAVCPFASQAYRYDLLFPSRGYVGGPPKGVLHTTETGVLPGYDGGSKAPHFTVVPVAAQRLVRIYQHFDTARPSRALQNLARGVQTNNDSAVQIELVGTTVASIASRTGWMHWASAPRWALDGLRDLMIWIEQTSGIRPESTPRPWLPDGAGYGTSPARMTPAEWDAFNAWCGHMHVPENTHSDPGALPIGYLLTRTPLPVPSARRSTVFFVRRSDQPHVWVSDGINRRHVPDPASLTRLQGVAQWGLTGAERAAAAAVYLAANEAELTALAGAPMPGGIRVDVDPIDLDALADKVAQRSADELAERIAD